MSTFTRLKGRIRSDLADRIPVTFLDTELFQFAVEGAGLIHSYIAQALFVLIWENKQQYLLLKGIRLLLNLLMHYL